MGRNFINVTLFFKKIFIDKMGWEFIENLSIIDVEIWVKKMIKIGGEKLMIKFD
jgi:hypothetical protein